MSGELDGKPRLYYPRCKATLDIILDGFGALDGVGSQDTPLHVPGVFPTSAKIHSNAYHNPDEFELTFDAKDCPFDPALIRAATVQIFMYDAGQMDTPQRAPTLSEIYEVPDFVGMFDDDSMEMSNDGRWITVQGQDLTTLFSGKQWKPLPSGRARRLPTGMPLNKFVSDMVEEVDDTGRMKVVLDVADDAMMPIVGDDSPAGHGRGIPVQQGTTYWDVIYKTVIRHGFICYVRGWDVVIANPKNLEDFRNADVVRMEWGNNIEHITLQRKLGKQKVPNIIVVAYDEDGQMSTRVEWPDSGTSHKAGAKLSNGNKTRSVEKHTIKGVSNVTAMKRPPSSKPKATIVKRDEEFMVIPVHGTWKNESLLMAAKAIHTLVGRGERRIIVKTHDLTDTNGKPLLHLMAGDAAKIYWKDFNPEDGNSMQTMTYDKRIQYLVGRGYQQDVAVALSTAYDKFRDKMNPPMRIREVTKHWDGASGGLSIEMELVDFAVVTGERT